MKPTPERVSFAVFLIGLALAAAAAAQEPTTSELKKDIQRLQESIQGTQKDLQEIKGMLARPAPRPSGIGAVIDYGQSPTKGERTAKLTVVEFSDYQ